MAETTNANNTPATQNQAKAPVKYNTDFSPGIFGSSDNFMMATQMAKAFASSTIVPKEYQGNYANGLVAIDMQTGSKQALLRLCRISMLFREDQHGEPLS